MKICKKCLKEFEPKAKNITKCIQCINNEYIEKVKKKILI